MSVRRKQVAVTVTMRIDDYENDWLIIDDLTGDGTSFDTEGECQKAFDSIVDMETFRKIFGWG